MVWFIIYFLQIIAKIILWIPCLIWGAIESTKKGEFKEWFKDLDTASDAYGNVLIKYPANVILIKKGGDQFGKLFDMISKVLGKNKQTKTLKKPGQLLAAGLNILDKNHVEKAIE